MHDTQSNLRALKFGSREDKYNALVNLEESASGISEEVRLAVADMMAEAVEADDFALAHQAALALAANEDKSDATVAVLLQGLTGEYTGEEASRFGKIYDVRQIPTLLRQVFTDPGEKRERDVLRQMWSQYDSLRALSRFRHFLVLEEGTTSSTYLSRPHSHSTVFSSFRALPCARLGQLEPNRDWSFSGTRPRIRVGQRLRLPSTCSERQPSTRSTRRSCVQDVAGTRSWS
jgi:hypothetical protein